MTIKRKIIISIIFFLGLTIFLLIFIIYPLFLEIKESSQNFLSEKKKLMILEKKVENLAKIELILPEISANLKKIDAIFIDPMLPIDFIRFLEKISQDCQVSLEILLLSGLSLKTEGGSWPFLSFQLNLKGSFVNFSKFLEKLESSFYLIEIQNLNIAYLDETKKDIKADLLIKVYTK